MTDLNTGLRVPKKDALGNWTTEYIQYQELLKSYCVNTIPRQVFLSKYKSLTPIEAFSAKEKSDWKKFVNATFPGTTPQFRLEAVKIIYTIGTLTNES